MKRLLSILSFDDSRKVSFAVYLFVFSGAFLCFGKISAGDWLTCMFLCSALIGGGTIADTYLKGKSGVVANK